MPFCVRCVPFGCGGSSQGIISLEWSTRGSLTYVPNDCNKPPSVADSTADSDEYIVGPVLGEVSLNTYAFVKGQDRWLGSRCMAQVQGSQVLTQKYDMDTEEYYLIPSKSNSGQISGDIDSSIASLGEVKCVTKTYKSNLVNGATVATEMETYLGGDLQYNGYPIAFEFPLIETAFQFDLSYGSIFSTSFNISSMKTFLTSFNLNVNFPEPAVASYSFQFILDCGGSTGGGGTTPL